MYTKRNSVNMLWMSSHCVRFSLLGIGPTLRKFILCTSLATIRYTARSRVCLHHSRQTLLITHAYTHTQLLYKHSLPVASIFIVPVSHLPNWFLSRPLLCSTHAAKGYWPALGWQHEVMDSAKCWWVSFEQTDFREHKILLLCFLSLSFDHRHIFLLIHSLANHFLNLFASKVGEKFLKLCFDIDWNTHSFMDWINISSTQKIVTNIDAIFFVIHYAIRIT